MTPDQVASIIAPLRGICRRKRLSFEWRTYRDGMIWRAEMRAGHPPRHGARPCWTGAGTTEEAALDRAAAGAIYYWDDLAQTGIARSLLDMIYGT